MGWPVTPHLVAGGEALETLIANVSLFICAHFALIKPCYLLNMTQTGEIGPGEGQMRVKGHKIKNRLNTQSHSSHS